MNIRKSQYFEIMIFLVVILLILWIYRLPAYDFVTSRVIWDVTAKENIEGHIYMLSGEKYNFANGTLKSKCNKINSIDHCPFKASSDDNIFFDTKNFYTKVTTEEELEINDVNIFGFFEAGEIKHYIEFIIWDYVLNPGICKESFFNDTTCSINWYKKFPIEKISDKRNDVIVNVKRFDVNKSGNTLVAEISGEISGNSDDIKAELNIYKLFGKVRLLSEQKNLSLVNLGNKYVFSGKITYQTSPIVRTASSSEITVKDRNSVLLLITGDDYFYAEEKTIENGVIAKYYVYE